MVVPPYNLCLVVSMTIIFWRCFQSLSLSSLVFWEEIEVRKVSLLSYWSGSTLLCRISCQSSYHLQFLKMCLKWSILNVIISANNFFSYTTLLRRNIDGLWLSEFHSMVKPLYIYLMYHNSILSIYPFHCIFSQISSAILISYSPLNIIEECFIIIWCPYPAFSLLFFLLIVFLRSHIFKDFGVYCCSEFFSSLQIC